MSERTRVNVTHDDEELRENTPDENTLDMTDVMIILVVMNILLFLTGHH